MRSEKRRQKKRQYCIYLFKTQLKKKKLKIYK